MIDHTNHLAHAIGELGEVIVCVDLLTNEVIM